MSETEAGPGTPRREPLSRERIIRAAVRVMDQEGLEAVTMRRLGRELGVEAMSLYNHVRGKEDILAGLVDAVMGELEIPEGGGDWVERLRGAARSFRAVLHRHPNILPLFAEHLDMASLPNVLRAVEAALGILRGARLSEVETVHAYRTLVGYVMGYVTQEVGGLFAEHPHPATGSAPAAALASTYPVLAQLLPHLERCDPDEDFEFGLDAILTGLRAKLHRRPSAAT